MHDVMSVRKARPRKRATAARIEVSMWFEDWPAYLQFATVPFGPKARTISGRGWVMVEATEDEGVTARLQFTHTCRNEGAHQSDALRFFCSTANAAGLSRDQLEFLGARLISRDRDVPQADLHVRDRLEARGYYSS